MDRGNRSFTSLRSRMTAPDVVESITFLSQRVEDLEIVLNTKSKEIRRIETMNKQLISGLQKRDEIIASALEENRKLKESLRWYQRLLSQAKKPKSEASAPPPKPVAHTLSVPTTAKGTRRLWTTENTAKIRLFDDLMEGDDSFADRFTALDPQAQRDFLQKIRSQNQDYKNLVDVTLRLKKLINSTHKVAAHTVVSDMLDTLVDEVCDNLRCDRASVFVLDELNGELWTKVAKGTSGTIRLPADKGIVGFVATSGKPVNIEDAYKDSRFNKTVDLHMNYRTKTILAIPMRDSSGKIIGVCEAINKLEGAFTPDDEGLFEMLATNAGAVLRNSMQYESIMQMQNRLKTLFLGVEKLIKCGTVPDLVQIATDMIQSLLAASQVRFYLCGKETMIAVEPDGMEEAFLPMGLVGHCAEIAQLLNIENAYQHPLFNNQVDIETSMPIIVYPVQSETGEVLGVLEFVNPKGIQGRAEAHKAKIDPLDFELLGYYAKLLAVALGKLFIPP